MAGAHMACCMDCCIDGIDDDPSTIRRTPHKSTRCGTADTWRRNVLDERSLWVNCGSWGELKVSTLRFMFIATVIGWTSKGWPIAEWSLWTYWRLSLRCRTDGFEGKIEISHWLRTFQMIHKSSFPISSRIYTDGLSRLNSLVYVF